MLDPLAELKAAALDQALTTAPGQGKRNQTPRALYVGLVRREFVAEVIADAKDTSVGALLRRVQEVQRGDRPCSPRAARLRAELRRLGDQFPESRTALRELVLACR